MNYLAFEKFNNNSSKFGNNGSTHFNRNV
jgi:hypothetical protein